MIKYVVIDDEEDGRLLVKMLMNKYFPNSLFYGEGEEFDQAKSLLSNKDVNLVFLDIKLGDRTCFEFLDELNRNDLYVIFISAFEGYTLKSFQYNVLDYLLKPLDFEEFKRAIGKAQKLLNTNEGKLENTSINIHTTEAIYTLEIQDIIRIESSGNYCTIYSRNKKPITVSKLIKELESMINDKLFIRIHQSHVVNLAWVDKFEKDSGSLVLKDQSIVPVSRRKKEVLLKNLYV